MSAPYYVAVGVNELDQDKLTPLLRLQYHDSIADAVADLGKPDEIGRVFSGLQKYLYEQAAAWAPRLPGVDRVPTTARARRTSRAGHAAGARGAAGGVVDADGEPPGAAAGRGDGPEAHAAITIGIGRANLPRATGAERTARLAGLVDGTRVAAARIGYAAMVVGGSGIVADLVALAGVAGRAHVAKAAMAVYVRRARLADRTTRAGVAIRAGRVDAAVIVLSEGSWRAGETTGAGVSAGARGRFAPPRAAASLVGRARGRGARGHTGVPQSATLIPRRLANLPRAAVSVEIAFAGRWRQREASEGTATLGCRRSARLAVIVPRTVAPGSAQGESCRRLVDAWAGRSADTGAARSGPTGAASGDRARAAGALAPRAGATDAATAPRACAAGTNDSRSTGAVCSGTLASCAAGPDSSRAAPGPNAPGSNAPGPNAPGSDAPAASAPTAGSSGDSSAAATCIWACLRIGQQRRIHRGRGIGAIDLARSATAVAGQHRKSRQGDEAK